MLKLGGEWAVWTSLQSSRYCELSYQLGTFGPSTNKKINLDLRPFRHIWAVHIPESVVPSIHTKVHIIPGIASALIFSLCAILLWRTFRRRAYLLRADQMRPFEVLFCRWSDARIAGLASHYLQHHIIYSRALNAGIVRLASYNVHNYRARSAEWLGVASQDHQRQSQYD